MTSVNDFINTNTRFIMWNAFDIIKLLKYIYLGPLVRLKISLMVFSTVYNMPGVALRKI
jgi:hypothetical protein